MTNQLELLEYAITVELEARIIELGDNVDSAMSDIQPPTSIAHAAAVAAAQVLMAFERGYRMESAPEELSLPALKTEHLGFWVETQGGQRIHIHGDPNMSPETLEALINAVNLTAGQAP